MGLDIDNQSLGQRLNSDQGKVKSKILRRGINESFGCSIKKGRKLGRCYHPNIFPRPQEHRNSLAYLVQ